MDIPMGAGIGMSHLDLSMVSSGILDHGHQHMALCCSTGHRHQQGLPGKMGHGHQYGLQWQPSPWTST